MVWQLFFFFKGKFLSPAPTEQMTEKLWRAGWEGGTVKKQKKEKKRGREEEKKGLTEGALFKGRV